MTNTCSVDPDQLASISWLLKKPTDLDLHCLLRQGMSCSAREGLTFITLGRQQIDDSFSYFSQKIGFNISCNLSLKETICMKCLSLFSRKNIKNISECCLLKY